MSGKARLFALRPAHSDIGLDVLRAFLGAALCARGVMFVLGGNARILELVRAGGTDYFLPAIALQATTALHLIGGVMLALGLLTRVAALVQIPVLAGAVYLSTLQGGLLSIDQSLELSVLVLFLLCVFFVYGSGPFSLDGYFVTHAEVPQARPSEAPFEWVDRFPDESPGEVPASIPLAETVSPETEHARRLYVMALAKYGFISVLALVLVVIGVRNLPTAVGVAELGAIGALVLVIVGIFLFFYHSAFQDE